MGGGKGGGGGTDWDMVAGQNAYNAAAAGQSRDAVIGADPQYAAALTAGYDKYVQEQQLLSMFKMPEMPDYSSDYEDSTAEYEAKLEEQKRLEAEGKRDELYSSYLDAAGAATDYVNAEITQERSNARLLGVDYDITEEQKSGRISDYFSTIWGEGDQATLEGYITDWGAPEGFEEFTITRGDGGTYSDKAAGGETQVSTSKGLKPTILTEDEEDTLGASGSILGG